MIREFDRYVVVKKSHAQEALLPSEYRELYRLGMKVAAWRSSYSNKPPFECVVVEHDWPEYESVWAMIERRVDAPTNYPDWLNRLIHESKTLDDNRAKLLAYIKSIRGDLMGILTEQWEVMTHLSIILQTRVDAALEMMKGDVRP